MRNCEELLDDTYATEDLTLEIILCMSKLKDCSSSRILSSNYILNFVFEQFFGSSLREHGISFYSSAPILEKAFFVFQVLRVLYRNYWR